MADTPDDTAPTAAAGQQSSLLRDANFLKYVTVRGVNVFGIQIVNITVGWQVYEMTSDPLDLGLLGLSQFLPILLLFPVTGLAADRLNRRAIIAVCNAIHVLVALFLLGYALSGRTDPWPIFLVFLLHGAARSFYQPAIISVLPNIVPMAVFPNAVAYSSSINKAGHLAGPAAGGVLIALIDEGAFLVAAAGFAATAVAGALLVTTLGVRAKRGIGLEALLGGFTYIWSRKVLLGTMSIDLIAAMFSGVMGMMPVFARDILEVGPEGLGVLRAMPAVGAVVVGFLLAQMPITRNIGPVLILSTLGFGLASSAFALSTSFFLSIVLLALYGGADMVSTYVRQTLVQLATPDEMRGRVGAVHGAVATGSNDIGDFRAGLMSAAIGIVPAVFVGGLVTMGLSALWWRAFPELRKVDRFEDAR